MYTINSIIQKNKRNNKNHYPVYIRLTVSRLHSYFNTGLKVEEKYWDENKGRLKSNYPNSNAANYLISSLSTKIEAECIRLMTEEVPFTAAMVKKNLCKPKESINFIEYANKWINTRKERNLIRLSTQLRYNAVLEKLNNYVGDNLEINEFNYEFLIKYELYLSKKLGNSINTITANMKMFRAIFKDIVNDGLIPMSANPFNRYEFRSTSVEIKYLEGEQIKMFENIMLPDNSKIKECRDIFLFCLNTGFRIGDALSLKIKDITSTHFIFKSQKTKNEVSIYITQKAMNIIDKYISNKEPNDLIFSFLIGADETSELGYHKAHKSATALINKNLGIISKRIGLAFTVSTHYARHSLAKNGLKNGLSMEEIQAILHHKNIKTTQIYASAVKEMTDRAMKKYDESMKSAS